jgi:hypothetical protein
VPLSELEAAVARPEGPQRAAALARIRAQMGRPVTPEEREKIRESITWRRGLLDAQLGRRAADHSAQRVNLC